ncbi:MAG TPA: lipocalin-like domain-containing protein [Luteibacter sp.]|uniref:lipocalin-like domain-containing protein n=1 Tax=Luteibacter sp. TaxID=1886636 RepID=UPI002C622B47|nr:lipocalin-like domain-containing protein [Luteibacter sp.]HVI53554.1 lipocalin-like domain-containing protein [Luteibacter sp.]
MKHTHVLAFAAVSALASSLAATPLTAFAADMPAAGPGQLVGAWTLVRCDNVYPDGHRIELYGPNPEGLWVIDAQGDYMMQIVRSKRMPFANNDKSKGTPEEYRAASMDFNAHYGTVSVEGMVMHSHILQASFPNWNGKGGDSTFVIKGDELTYTVAKPSSGAAEGAHGEVVWRRIHS